MAPLTISYCHPKRIKKKRNLATKDENENDARLPFYSIRDSATCRYNKKEILPLAEPVK